MPNAMMELRAMETRTFVFEVCATKDGAPLPAMRLPAAGADEGDAQRTLRQTLARTGYENVTLKRARPTPEGDERR